jgi:hypothetical protein
MNLFKTLSGLGHKERIKVATDDLFTRAQAVSPATAGGFTVPTTIGPLQAALFPFSAVLRAGAQVVNLKTFQTLPQVESSIGASWVSETEEVQASSITFGQLAFAPHRLAAVAECSKRLLVQAPELAEPVIERNVRQAFGYAIDVGALSGLGAGGEPLGVLNDPTISEPVTFSGPAALLDMCAFEKGIGDNFGEQGPLTFIGSVAAREKLRQIQKWTGSSTGLWDDDEIIGKTAIATPAIANTDSRLILGCWSLYQLIFFGQVDITRDDLTRAKEGIVRFIFNFWADCGALQADAFARSTDSASQ